MKKIKEINIINNKGIIIKLNIASIFLLILLLTCGIAMAQPQPISFSFSLMNMVVFLILLILSFMIHELIHGLFFWLFSKKRVVFGFKSGMLYAASPGSLYTKYRYLIIVLTPFLGLSFIYYLLFYFAIIDPVSSYLLFAVHTAGCIGDFWYVYVLAKQPKEIMIKDTEVGIEFYLDENK